MTVRVVIIDSSLNPEHPHLAGALLEAGPRFAADGSRTGAAPLHDALGHGTCTAAAIHSLAPQAVLHVVQVFETDPRCSFAALLAALEYSAGVGAQLVNLSLGTARASHAEACSQAVQRLRAAGAALVAPLSFQGLPSFPGVLPDVYGVKEDATLTREAPVLRALGGRMVWHASPLPRPLPNLPIERNLSGASLAAANFTAWCAARLERGESLP
ncbi:MAG: hypothetical protein EXS14_08560 [Planctomycetes bacterium]|nr:hypothetical protein [Planctomycetota bacterium]